MNYVCWKMAPNTRVTRKWEMFAGRNKFYCDGFLMTAPHSGVFYLTVVLITGTSSLFFAFDCPFLAENITPAIPIIGAILYLFTMSSLFRTSFTDPGIIPRASHDEAAYIEQQIEVPNSLNSPTYRPPPRTKEVLVRGQTVKLKYCFTCKIFRPPRASHCSLCDNCVDRFDHHCPWVGNCVGRRNYRFFYMFIVSLAFLAVFIFFCALTHIILLTKDDKVLIDVIKQVPVSVIIALICFLSFWSVIALAGFHTYLTSSDQTTNEDIKGSFSSKSGQQAKNPYSRGNICLNCFHILCGPMPPSLIDRRGVVTDEYRIQMQMPDPIRYAAPLVPMVQALPSVGQLMNHSTDRDLNLATLNPGMYRQRSYDNLQNGHSNSTAHLVDNEIPLATLHSTIGGGGGGIIATAGGGLHSENHLSGSYTNLYRGDKCDDTIVPTILVQQQLPLNGDVEQQLQSQQQPIVVQPKRDNTSTTTSIAIAVSLVENVYSNIPSNGLDNESRSNSDPNLHVYSNISSGSNTNLHELSFGSNDECLARRLTGSDTMLANASSTLMSDDLDLDDPVIPTSAVFRTQVTTTVPTISAGNMPAATVIANVPDTNRPVPTVPAIVIVEPSSNTVKSVKAVANASGGQSTVNGNTFISASRLRLLHDTTMIDTALDLDSLDGSSLGNNSQVGLVKTALV